MKYTLVVQWPASSIADYDAMLSTERALMEALPDGSEIDGHDAGAGEINIFVVTNAPLKVFETIKLVLADLDLLTTARVAFRGDSNSKYTILWPAGLEIFSVT
jgi:hypothetical protein